VSLGPAEIVVIFVVALLVFGPTRLPEIGRQFGRGIREFRKFQQTLRTDLDQALAEDATDAAEPAPELPPLPAASKPSEGTAEADASGAGQAPASPVDDRAPAPPAEPA
jgi:TatA/E family protein of Tat protein translocase